MAEELLSGSDKVVMNRPSRKNMIRSITTVVGMFGVSVILILHNTWGDERYVQKPDAIRQEISRIDTELTVLDQEIIFAETARAKQKFEAIKAIYEREKEALAREIEK